MGYHKNQLIAQDIEVGDRIPEPMPWTAHASLTRRQVRQTRKAFKRARYEFAVSMWGMYAIGFATALMMWLLVGVFA